LELGIQSHNELVLEVAAEMGLDGMGENDNENDDDNEEVVATIPAADAPVATIPAAITPVAVV
jgi:hypothetical protein